MDCKKFSSTIPALLIAAGIVISGFALKAGIDNFAFRDREVSVRGLAERTVKADNASWNVSYTITGNDLQALYAQLEDKTPPSNPLSKIVVSTRRTSPSAYPRYTSLRPNATAKPTATIATPLRARSTSIPPR